jgi:hypothetical protein
VVLAIVLVAALGATSYLLLSADDGRHELEGLSCPTGSIATAAVDFQSGSTWATATEALAALQASVPGIQRDGWKLELQGSASMRWVRETDGHVVSLATFRWAGGGWAYQGLTACADEG